jgi:hypothetical protein
MTMLYTTLNKIRAHHPCKDGWATLLAGLGKTEADDEPLPFAQIVEVNGLADALWATRSAPEHDKDWRLFAVWCARQVLVYTDDWRAVQAVNVAERYAYGMASMAQLCRAAAHAAAYGAAVRAAAHAAAYGAYAAHYAAAHAAAVRAAQEKRFLEIVS